MKRLKLFDHIETNIVRRVAVPMRRVAIVEASPDRMDKMALERKVAVDYRLMAGARLIVEDTDEGIRQGHERVAEMLARQMYSDIRDELLDLQEWAWEQGIGRDLEEKVQRIIRLVEGGEIEQ